MFLLTFSEVVIDVFTKARFNNEHVTFVIHIHEKLALNPVKLNPFNEGMDLKYEGVCSNFLSL